jgi:peptide/nickel transport system substrate-binding protein
MTIHRSLVHVRPLLKDASLDFRPLRLLQGDLEQPQRLGAQHGVTARGRGSLADATSDAAARGEKKGFIFPIRFLKKSRYANGTEVLLLSGNAGYEPRQAEVLQAQLAKLNIKANISLNDFPTFRKRWLEEKQWDIVQLQWDADLDPDETLFPELHSTETWNAGRWINPEFGRLVELAQVEADQKKRKQYYDEAVKILIAETPSAIILHENEQKIFTKYVKGFQSIPVNAIDMHRIWLDKAL